MLKVTTSNVTKLSETALYIELDRIPSDHPIAHLIEAELDRRLEYEKRLLQKQQDAQLASLRLTHVIQEEISRIFEGFKGKKTLILIENLGQEFIEDYTICESTFTVKSLVAHRFSDNSPSTWEFDSISEANSKKARLIYDRIYSKFMRDATSENLEILKRILL